MCVVLLHVALVLRSTDMLKALARKWKMHKQPGFWQTHSTRLQLALALRNFIRTKKLRLGGASSHSPSLACACNGAPHLTCPFAVISFLQHLFESQQMKMRRLLPSKRNAGVIAAPLTWRCWSVFVKSCPSTVQTCFGHTKTALMRLCTCHGTPVTMCRQCSRGRGECLAFRADGGGRTSA